MNSFGLRFKFTTFGESHGKAIGCIVDGLPSGIAIKEQFIQAELDRRKPGGRYSTSRQEADCVEILSGVFEGYSTGSPISMIIFNKDHKSKDYTNIKDLFRPGHADFTYHYKYGIRDYRGGGRSSARETAARVAAGAIAKLLIREVGIEINSGVCQVGNLETQESNFDFAKNSIIYSLDKDMEQPFKDLIDRVREDHNSIGGAVKVKIQNSPIGLGEPIYYKIDALLADGMMSINGVKAVEIGDGCEASSLTGLQNCDQISRDGFNTNHSGGILGGISNGEDIDIKIHFKPTPSIFKPLNTLDTNGHEAILNLKGRHDPCIAIRGSIVTESMAACVMADMLLLNLGRTIKSVKKAYLD